MPHKTDLPYLSCMDIDCFETPDINLCPGMCTHEKFLCRRFRRLQDTNFGVVVGKVVAEWLVRWTQAQKGPGSNRSRDAVGNSLRQTVHTHRAFVH